MRIVRNLIVDSDEPSSRMIADFSGRDSIAPATACSRLPAASPRIGGSRNAGAVRGETIASLVHGAIEIEVMHLDLKPRALLASTDLLSDDERRRAERFFFARDRRRFIVARAGLRQRLARRLGIDARRVVFAYGAHGKPQLSKTFADADLHFSVSHCDDVAAFAISPGREIGIDIESIRPFQDADAIAERCFCPRESDAYRALGVAERPLGFFNCWTRKEAFVKALGEGLRYPLARVEVSLTPGAPARIIRAGNVPGRRCGWTLHGFVPAAGITGAFVVRRAQHCHSAREDTSRRPVRPSVDDEVHQRE